MDTLLNIIGAISDVIHSIPMYIFVIGVYVLGVDYFLSKKPKFVRFLGRFRKNFNSVVIINVMAWAGIIVVYYDAYSMEIGWLIFSYCFLALIIFLGWLRVWLLHKRIERVDEMYSHTTSSKK